MGRDSRALVLAVCVACVVFGLPVFATAQSQSGEAGVRLEQNFPNPFTPGVSPTIFTYRLAREEHVRLTVYNLLAQEVAVLVDQVEEAGLHRVAWEGADKNGDRVPAGVYWYKLEAGDQTALKRLRVRDSTEPASG